MGIECEFCNCPASKNYYGRGLCQEHYQMYSSREVSIENLKRIPPQAQNSTEILTGDTDQ